LFGDWWNLGRNYCHLPEAFYPSETIESEESKSAKEERLAIPLERGADAGPATNGRFHH
jgi:hypothetical protein